MRFELGRKARNRMLPRISEALTKFLTPITRTKNKVTDPKRKKNQEFQRFKNKNQSKPELKKQESESPASEEEESKPHFQLAQPPSEPEEPPEPGVGQSFIQLVSSIQKGKGDPPREAGVKAYQNNLKNQRMTAKFRKGTIIDQKDESES